jgi:fatty-acyl-CoA synthase
VIDFQTAVMEQPDDRLIFGEPGRDRDIAAYFHTGGTTGRPRLVAHSHHGQLVTAFGGAVLGGLGPTDTITATLPLFHVGGTIFCGLGVFMAGAHLLVMSPSGLRHPVVVQEFWRLVARHRATLVGGVPTALAAVLRSSFDGADLGSMRLGFTGAASLPPAVGDEFRRATGCRLHEIYGMTEASGVISVDAASDGTGQGSAGLPLPYTQVQVRRVGPDGRPGAPCAAGEIGVVIVQGPHVSPGYLDPDHNAGVLEGDTLDSGDLGYFDAQGQLHIAGRVKDLIIRSGHNVDPLMIENAMASHPAVATAAAVGMPDAYAGELPVCYVALHAGAQVAQDELAAHARNTIAERPAWPKQIYIVDAIPVTEVGKIYKPQLRCDAAVRAVRALLAERFALDSAHVEAHHGGVRGLRIAVRLPHQRREIAAPVEQALAAYLFESDVRVASDDT